MNKLLKAAIEFKNINKQLKLHLVGSLARHDPKAKDIDFITHLTLPNNKQVYHTHFNGYKIDIWQYKDLALGKFLRSLDKGHIIAIYKGLAKNGYRLTLNGIIDIQTNKIIKFTPQRAFNFAGFQFDPQKYFYLV